MNITFIGSGNVAHALGQLWLEAGHKIVQVISAQEAHARELGEKLSTHWSNDLDHIDPVTDVIILAVNDNALPLLNKELRLKDHLVVHTAGGVPMHTIAGITEHIGVFYPLQTFRKETETSRKFPVLLEASRESDRELLDALARSISRQVIWMSSAERLKMHVAGVFCNNFVHRLMTMTKDFCEKESLDFFLLKPLLEETFNRVTTERPEDLQTGPARRGDTKTMELHEQVLKAYPGMLKTYQILSEEIKIFYNK